MAPRTPASIPSAETVRADQVESAELSSSEQEEIRATDSADNARRTEEPDLSDAKRIRAIPAIITNNGDRGTTVQVTTENFQEVGIDHPTITFDARDHNHTLVVGDEDGQVSPKAADYLTKNHPGSFEFLDNGK